MLYIKTFFVILFCTLTVVFIFGEARIEVLFGMLILSLLYSFFNSRSLLEVLNIQHWASLSLNFNFIVVLVGTSVIPLMLDFKRKWNLVTTDIHVDLWLYFGILVLLLLNFGIDVKAKDRTIEND